MGSIYQTISELEKSRKPAAICFVIDSKGSTPRKAGAKMIVFPDGKIIGTIGGGSIEKQVIEDAKEVIKQNTSIKKAYNLAVDLGMSCGGAVEVYIEPVCKIDSLYVFGAGHIGRVVAKFATELDFNVTIFDNREDIFESIDLKDVNFVKNDYFESIEHADFDNNTYIVIVTPNHTWDEEVLSKVAKKEHAYVGMIGSKRKIEGVRKKFLENNILSEDQLNSIDMPIGIKLNAETPQEIAVSIIAKLIDVRNSRN